MSPLCELGAGNPYIGSKTQNGFATFGQPGIAATLVAVAGKAIREVWYHAHTCNERFRISLTRVDGTSATMTNLWARASCLTP